MSEAITFPATVARVQTMADGGLRFIFDAPESAVMQAAQLMECKRFGAVLDVSILTRLDDETKKGAERKTPKVDSRRITKRRNK